MNQLEPRAGDGAENVRAALSDRGVGRRRVRKFLLTTIALLYVLSVPWYRDSDAPLRVVFGFPDWVAIAIACYIGVAILNAILWKLTDIADVLDTDEDTGRGHRDLR